MNVFVTVIVVASALKLYGKMDKQSINSSIDINSTILVFVGYHLSFTAVNVKPSDNCK